MVNKFEKSLRLPQELDSAKGNNDQEHLDKFSACDA